MATRDGAVARKCPDTPGRCGSAADTADDCEDNQRQKQANGTSGRADGRLEDRGHRLAGCEGEELVDVGEHEEQRNHKEQSGDGVEGNGANHGLGDLGGGFAHLLAHAYDHASR